MRKINRVLIIIGAFLALFGLFFVVGPFLTIFYLKKTIAISMKIQEGWWNAVNAGYILILFLWGKWKKFFLNLLLAVIVLAWSVFGLDIPLKLHFIFFSAISFFALKKFDNSANAIMGLYSFAIANELIQFYIPYRVCEIKDLISNCIAVSFGIAWWHINNGRISSQE